MLFCLLNQETLTHTRAPLNCLLNPPAAGAADGVYRRCLGESRPVFWVPDAAVPALPTLGGTTLCADFINGISNAFARSAGSKDVKALEGGWPVPDMTKFLPKNPSTGGGGGETTVGKTKPAKTESVDYTYTDAPNPNQVYYEAQAMVAGGRVEVRSKHSKVKYDEGYLDATLLYVVDDDGAKPITPTTTTYITTPYNYNLKLKKSGNYY